MVDRRLCDTFNRKGGGYIGVTLIVLADTVVTSTGTIS